MCRHGIKAYLCQNTEFITIVLRQHFFLHTSVIYNLLFLNIYFNVNVADSKKTNQSQSNISIQC